MGSRMSSFFDEIAAKLATLSGVASPEVSRDELNEFNVRDIQAVRVSEGDGGGGSQPDVGLAAGGAYASYIPCAGARGVSADDPGLSTTNADEFGISAEGADGFVAWFLPVPIAVADFAWKVLALSTAVGKYRLALYAADASWQPSSLLWQSSEQDGEDGTLQTDTVDLDLPAGRYLAAFTCDQDFVDNAPGLMAYFGKAAAGVGVLTTDDLETGNTPAIWTRSRAYGAFPNPGDPWDTVSKAVNDSSALATFFATLS